MADPASRARAASQRAEAGWVGASPVASRLLGGLVDPFVVNSFDRVGYRIHQLGFEPGALDVDLSDRHVLVTGANSGLGFEVARALALRGAHLRLLCRTKTRGERAAAALRKETGNAEVRFESADLSKPDSIDAFAERLGSDPVDVLVHNAGLLPDERVQTKEGFELTFATHVIGPHRLTRLLRPKLEASTDARVVWVSSGGMLTRRLNMRDPNWTKRDYDGTLAYAETKRAQVVLAELWADELRAAGVSVNAMHPGWADTPGVRSSLPRFYSVMKPFLRTPAEGADTAVWLAAARAARAYSGRFFFDRQPARTHWVSSTRETAEERATLWRICEEAADDAP